MLVVSSKTFFGKPQIFLISTDVFTKREKVLHCFTSVSFLKGKHLEAGSLACISDFVDKNA